MRRAVRLLLHAATGVAALALFELLGRQFGMGIGLNVFNILFVTVLGLPGFALLLIAQVLFT